MSQNVLIDVVRCNRSTYLFMNVMEMFSDEGGGNGDISSHKSPLDTLIQSSKSYKTEQHELNNMRQWNVFFLSLLASEVNQILFQSGKYHL